MIAYLRPPLPAGHRLGTLFASGRRLLRAVAFWTAIVLPVGYGILLSVPTEAGIEVWSLLLGGHVLALLVGHGHLGDREPFGSDSGTAE